MQLQDFDAALVEQARTHPQLFELFRCNGWSARWSAPIEAVESEPHWRRGLDFPMHELARAFLVRFLGLRCPGKGWKGVVFGSSADAVANTLRDTDPYDVEECILLEEDPASRPPAFPVATMNDWMIYLREDWQTITVAANWRDAYITPDPFSVIETFYLKKVGALRSSPGQHVQISTLDRVPSRLIGRAFNS